MIVTDVTKVTKDVLHPTIPTYYQLNPLRGVL